MKRHLNIDPIAGAGVMVVSVAAAIGALRFPTPSGAVPGPALFPLVISAILAAFGVVLLVSGLRSASPTTRDAPTMRRMAGLLGLTVIYAALMPLLGFVAASALFLTLAIRFLGYVHGWRTGAVALATAFVVFWLFAVVMKVPLPEGWIG